MRYLCNTPKVKVSLCVQTVFYHFHGFSNYFNFDFQFRDLVQYEQWSRGNETPQCASFLFLL